MKFFAWAAALFTLIGAGIYMVVSLNRWEWNRALFFALMVVITEVALATGLILRRLGQIQLPEAEPEVRAVLRETRPPSPNRFAWLDDSVRQFNVFIFFLVGGGIVVSGVAWVVDRVASVTSTPTAERRLAHQLRDIDYPCGGLLVDDVTVLAQDVPGADDGQIRRLLRRAR